jgi:hypothetical protein
MGELNERIREAEQRMTTLRERAMALGREIIDERDVARALAAFDPLWETLSPKEQARAVRLLYRIQFLRHVEGGIHAASPRRMRRCAAGVR